MVSSFVKRLLTKVPAAVCRWKPSFPKASRVSRTIWTFVILFVKRSKVESFGFCPFVMDVTKVRLSKGSGHD